MYTYKDLNRIDCEDEKNDYVNLSGFFSCLCTISGFQKYLQNIANNLDTPLRQFDGIQT